MKNKLNIAVAIIVLIISVFILINFSSCKDPVSPYDQLKSGRRDYVWEIDTLDIPFTFLRRIWGSDPNNVWAIGPGGDLDKTIYHYDGTKWNNDGVSRKISPISIWGFAANDVWLGGLEGRIWHYNGNDWSESLHIKDSVFVYSGFADIWGESNKNIWAIGFLDSAKTRKGIMYNYDGYKWKRINIDYKHGGLASIRRGKKTSNNYYLWGLWEDNFIGDSTKLLEYTGSKYLKELGSSVWATGKGHFIQEIDDEIFLTIDNSLYTYDKGKLELFITNSFLNSFRNIYGRSKKDIFWLMRSGITHFDGKDFQYILNFDTAQSLSDGVIFENSVFFLSKDFNNGLNIIYKGKLK